MDETPVRRLLDRALAGEPPMGPVARNAVRAGIKLRRRRRAQGLTGAAAVVGVIAAVAAAVTGAPGNAAKPPPVVQTQAGHGRMPVVAGLSLAAAEAKIKSAVTAPRFAILQVEASLPAGRVVAQIPVPGTRLAPGSRIQLTLSSGHTPPPCPATGGPGSATLSVVMRPAGPWFGKSCYYALAGRTLTLKLTNRAFTLESKQPTAVTLIISPSRHPAIVPIPGRPGMSTGSTARASFVSSPVTAPHTQVFTVHPLAAGTYVMQTLQGGLESTVRLIVRANPAPAAGLPTRLLHAPWLLPAPRGLTDRLVLQRTHVTAGTAIKGALVVTYRGRAPLNLNRLNPNGAGLTCRPQFALALTNQRIPPTVAFPQPCSQRPFLIKPGVNRLPVTVPTTCQVSNQAPACPGGRRQLPPLPAGRYEAVLIGDGLALPAPAPVPVTLSPARQTP